MKLSKVLALLLVLVLLLCLLPASALADPNDGEDSGDPGETELTGPGDEEPGEDPEEPAEEPEEPAEEPEEPADEPEEPAEEPEEPEPVINGADEVCYPMPGETVYNNGGTVYSNGALVYNNGGLVYQNDGTVYNNGGIVYANGGLVYNNGGIVYRNDAVVYTFADDVQDSHIYGSWRVTLAEDYSAFADIEGLTAAFYLSEDQACTVTPHEGWLLTDAEADAGTLTENEDGSWTLDQVNADLTLTLHFRAEAPVFDLEEGTYAEEHALSIRGTEGAEIFYSLDGSDPTEEGILYEEPIVLTEGVTVKAVAMAPGAEPSEVTEADYALITITAPEFEDLEEGAEQPKAAAFLVDNPGSTKARIESVKLEGENAGSFLLNTEAGASVKAGKTDGKTWTIRPAKDLKKGSYTACVIFTLEGGQTVELPVRITVK